MNPIAFLSNIMVDALRFFAYFGGYGWGIIWLTIAVNLALYPLTLSSVKSMAAMQGMQPRLQELQKKHKEEPQKLQKETMDLYRSEGINPVGGCLPVLLKIPFFLALFWAFQSLAFTGIASDPANNTSFLWITGRVPGKVFQSEKLVRRLVEAKIILVDTKASRGEGQKKYVWDAALKMNDKLLKDVLRSKSVENELDVAAIKDAFEPAVKGLDDEDAKNIIAAWNSTNSLAKPDRVNTPFGKISILALLIGITTFLMQKSLPSGGGQQAQIMTMFMPVFITFICWNFPAGVQLYWLVSNAVGALQQYYIMKKPHKRPKNRRSEK
ncbi:MAG: YidC/Oxa1 family membrane protein insertase [Candidatus Margulisbacteria bacterium]|nr:YidC/Oxa1 family membrane protein insertase [Candidatus Margulisiibacteriota bacterium]